MRMTIVWAAMACLFTAAAAGAEPKEAAPKAVKAAAAPEDKATPAELKDEASRSSGSINVAGRALSYQAEAGLLVVHAKDPLDEEPPPAGDKSPTPPPPSAAMSYVAYFLGKDPDAHRPVTFVFNGGPGSSTIWLHMGSFGPKRVVVVDGAHGPAAPYRIVDNAYTLLPETDLVFIDAPGTGFGHVRGADKDKTFFSVDGDARAFANFIAEFLSRHGRWNSPKYLFGESYGTTRAAALAFVLQQEKGVDLNGVMLLSQILCFDNSVDRVEGNPGVDQAYALALPTYAATAWYHKKLPGAPAALEPFLAEVEEFALGEYMTALLAGDRLAPERRTAVIARLHAYTGLPAEYLERADLRITGGVFEQHVLGAATTAGRLDARFSGPTIDPLAKEAFYDPQLAAIASPYVAALNDYVRRELKFGDGREYKYLTDLSRNWDFRHQPPGASQPLSQAANVMLDLAAAMKQNPNLQVQMHGGYYDIATPYFEAVYELHHLPVPASIARNIEIKLYPSGHMVYANEASAVALSANTAAFIRRTHATPGS